MTRGPIPGERSSRDGSPSSAVCADRSTGESELVAPLALGALLAVVACLWLRLSEPLQAAVLWLGSPLLVVAVVQIVLIRRESSRRRRGRRV